MKDGPESQTYTRLRRDALAARAANEAVRAPERGRAKLVMAAVLAIAALTVAAKLSGLF